jgi:hypothetical protein
MANLNRLLQSSCIGFEIACIFFRLGEVGAGSISQRGWSGKTGVFSVALFAGKPWLSDMHPVAYWSGERQMVLAFRQIWTI